jgi:hypothetical protein
MAKRCTVDLGRGWAWGDFFFEDPRSWILASEEPAARWVLLTGILDVPAADKHVVEAHAAVLTDPGTMDLIDRLPDWEVGDHLSGHDSPRFAPNLLNLLADMGVRTGDSSRVDRVLAQMLAHQDTDGRFPSSASVRADEPPVWGSLLCERHAIIEVLIRYGYAHDARVRAGLDRMTGDLIDTAQGSAWPCRPDPALGFRGPGRRGDFCPQVTLEALRAFGRLPESDRPPVLLDVARVTLGGWRRRGTEKPYMFGHGKTFKTVKWPSTWYGAYALLDALGRYPALWQGTRADPGDRRAMAELVACLIAYNAGTDGRVVPRSTYRGFEAFSFGQKKHPSAVATAPLLSVLHRLDDLTADAHAVDVTAIASSKGGSGRAVPPPGRPAQDAP